MVVCGEADEEAEEEDATLQDEEKSKRLVTPEREDEQAYGSNNERCGEDEELRVKRLEGWVEDDEPGRVEGECETTEGYAEHAWHNTHKAF